jgi:hypothetical protein
MRDIQDIEIATLNLKKAIAPAHDTNRTGLTRLPSLSTWVVVRYAFFPVSPCVILIDQIGCTIQELALLVRRKASADVRECKIEHT